MTPALLEQAIQFGCNFLWIDRESITVKIVPLKEHLFGSAYEVSEDEYEVEINEYASTENQLITLFHELAHVRQFMLKELFYRGEKMAWKGSFYESQEPWEVEARIYEQIMYTEFCHTASTVDGF